VKFHTSAAKRRQHRQRDFAAAASRLDVMISSRIRGLTPNGTHFGLTVFVLFILPRFGMRFARPFLAWYLRW